MGKFGRHGDTFGELCQQSDSILDDFGCVGNGIGGIKKTFEQAQINPWLTPAVASNFSSQRLPRLHQPA